MSPFYTAKGYSKNYECVIGVGNGGQPPPLKKNRGKIFFGQLLCKIRAFSGKNHVKFGNLVNFSSKNHVKFGHFVNFSYICFGQKCRDP